MIGIEIFWSASDRDDDYDAIVRKAVGSDSHPRKPLVLGAPVD